MLLSGGGCAPAQGETLHPGMAGHLDCVPLAGFGQVLAT